MGNATKERLEKKRGLIWLDVPMALIAIAQAVLIVVVAIVIYHHYQAPKEQNQSNSTAIQQPLNELQEDDTVSASSEEADKKVAKQDDSFINSFSTDYMTILLSLITLCATLAVVIPYLIGRIYTESQVDKKVQEIDSKLDKKKLDEDKYNEFSRKLSEDINNELNRYKDEFSELRNAYSERLQGVDSAIDQSIRILDVEVAHNARMISYLLSHKIGESENSLLVNAWTIGWASKALLRYTKHDYGNYFHLNKFINNSIDYIIVAGNNILDNRVENEEERSIILRALTDLFDSCYQGDINPDLLNSDVVRRKNELLNILNKLLKCIGDNDLAITAICSKSRYCKRETVDEIEEYRKTVQNKLREYNALHS